MFALYNPLVGVSLKAGLYSPVVPVPLMGESSKAVVAARLYHRLNGELWSMVAKETRPYGRIIGRTEGETGLMTLSLLCSHSVNRQWKRIWLLQFDRQTQIMHKLQLPYIFLYSDNIQFFIKENFNQALCYIEPGLIVNKEKVMFLRHEG